MGECGKETRMQKRKVGTVRWPLGAGAAGQATVWNTLGEGLCGRRAPD